MGHPYYPSTLVIPDTRLNLPILCPIPLGRLATTTPAMTVLLWPASLPPTHSSWASPKSVSCFPVYAARRTSHTLHPAPSPWAPLGIRPHFCAPCNNEFRSAPARQGLRRHRRRRPTQYPALPSLTPPAEGPCTVHLHPYITSPFFPQPPTIFGRACGAPGGPPPRWGGGGPPSLQAGRTVPKNDSPAPQSRPSTSHRV